MLRVIAVAAVAWLAAPAAAGEYSDLLRRLARMSPVDNVGARAAWDLWSCTEAAAKVIAERTEPGVLEPAWRPSLARPTLEDEAAEAMAQCAAEESMASNVLAAPEFAAIRASILSISTEAIRFRRDEQNRLRRE